MTADGGLLFDNPMEDAMSNTPGISPITDDIEEIRHSDDPAYDDSNDPEGKSGSEESDDEAAARIQRETLDLA
jgi:hypothetical protein